MRILYHHRTQAEDAQGIHIYEMVRAFRRLGHEVEMTALVELDRPGGRKVRGRLWSLAVSWAPAWLYELMSLAYNLLGYRQLYHRIRRRRPDVIYERYALNTFCGVWASRRFGIPLVLEVNAPLVLEQERLGKLAFRSLARRAETWICSRATWTIVVSSAMKGILASQGVPPEKILVMPNGIDEEMFDPRVSGEEVRRRHELDGMLVIGFVGWFREWHGLGLLLDVFREIREGEENACLLLVGDGPSFEELRRQAERHGILSRVVFAGPIPRGEIPAYVAAMDVAVQPRATEYASPMKIFEYMAMEKCIVAPDQQNIREILRDGATAFLFDMDDRDSFRDTLARVIRDPSAREMVGRAARQALLARGGLWKNNAMRIADLVHGPDNDPERDRTPSLTRAGE